MIGQRIRLVVVTNGERLVGREILAPSEVPEQLELEARLHELEGWLVERTTLYGMLTAVHCERGDTVRDIEASIFDPMNDNPKEASR